MMLCHRRSKIPSDELNIFESKMSPARRRSACVDVREAPRTAGQTSLFRSMSRKTVSIGLFRRAVQAGWRGRLLARQDDNGLLIVRRYRFYVTPDRACAGVW